jgi:hypothetical protein
MAYTITPVDVWVGAVEDRPGGLAEKLEALFDSGHNLDFMLAMRTLEMPGTGVVLVSPVEGEAGVEGNAGTRELSLWTTVHALRVEGPDRAGLAAQVTRAVAGLGISLRGASAARLGDRAVIHLAFDSSADADKALAALTATLW